MRPLTMLPPERSRLRHAHALMYALSGAIFLHGGAARAETPKIVKGPYLQALASDAVEVRVELASPVPITVTVTPPPGVDAGAARTVRDAVASAMHVVRIDGLAPATRYAYSVA